MEETGRESVKTHPPRHGARGSVGAALPLAARAASEHWHVSDGQVQAARSAAQSQLSSAERRGGALRAPLLLGRGSFGRVAALCAALAHPGSVYWMRCTLPLELTCRRRRARRPARTRSKPTRLPVRTLWCSARRGSALGARSTSASAADARVCAARCAADAAPRLRRLKCGAYVTAHACSPADGALTRGRGALQAHDLTRVCGALIHLPAPP